MSNKKVYLAKHTLASGFDVEYVKSHLSRIPGIIIVESGDRITPAECAAFVIVAEPNLDLDTDKINLSKNVTQDLEEFINDYSGYDCAENNIFIYSNAKETDEPLDIEESFPMSFYIDDNEITLKKKGEYDRFASISIIEDDQSELLYNISEIIDAPHQEWLKVNRHFVPEPQFAMPSLPSLEERLGNIAYAKAQTSTQYDLRLLLLRR